MPSSLAQKLFSRTMVKATQLTGMGKLLDATRLIQRTLFSAQPDATLDQRPATRRESNPAANDPQADKAQPSVIILPAPSRNEPSPATPPGRQASRAASFTKHQFVFKGDTYPYRLFIPSAPALDSSAASAMPLIVLLHGCKQDALDFSHGTAMNSLAETHQAMVLYPEQITSANAMRCWNWFEPGHQQAERGEPGMIAALTQKILQKHDGDPQRVYIAGLSAGGAMAAVVSGLYPGIFAAVGVHSGLAAGAAQDVMSAFGAMRSGAKGRSSPVIPTIVFHGSADKTVHPDNGDHIIDAALAAINDSGLKLVKTQSVGGQNGEEKTERVVYSSSDGKPYIENWRIDDGPHAWSGGDAAGSYTDPDGPSASAAMLAFFLQHRLRPA